MDFSLLFLPSVRVARGYCFGIFDPGSRNFFPLIFSDDRMADFVA